MKTVRYVSLFAAMALLASCVGWNVERLNRTDVSGNSFTQNLAREYRDLANFEGNRMQDWRSAELFARKGLAAAAGQVVEPEDPASWNISSDVLPAMTDGRNRLMNVFAAGAREQRPDIAAQAQTKFDCWVEQQSEGVQPDHIATCRDEFFAALALLEGVPAGQPVYMVFFDFDRSVITRDGQQVIAAVLRDYPQGRRVNVVGHTDTVGSAAYNQSLSERRAAATRQALVRGNIPNNLISTSGMGFRQLLVPTPPGVREPSNRRAEIRFE